MLSYNGLAKQKIGVNESGATFPTPALTHAVSLAAGAIPDISVSSLSYMQDACLLTIVISLGIQALDYRFD